MNTEGEIEFLRTYKDFIYHFNMLDRNIGYSLRYCSSKKGDPNPQKWHSKTFDSKVKKVIYLAKEYDVYDIFSDWHAQVQDCRYLRNTLSHGSWEWKWPLPKPIHFHAPEIKDGKGQFTTKEFREKFIYLKCVAETFGTIRTQLETAVEKAAKPVDSELHP
ncbi:hypothetical protein MLD52_17705 [Puniceicoccaceae bacterium K14]|nr:hypothetical protein [Puniceicoccaceae bacterium K14]